jgi:two-component system response regulator YesN
LFIVNRQNYCYNTCITLCTDGGIATEKRITEQCKTFAGHFAAVCKTPVTLVDTFDREIITTATTGLFYCGACKNECRLPQTLLYGCSEAKRWNGKYIFYCPAGLTFAAVTVPETDLALLAGPVVMGDLQDTLFDLPGYAEPELVGSLPVFPAGEMNHLAAVLETSAAGITGRAGKPVYEQEIILNEIYEATKRQEREGGFFYPIELERELRGMVSRQDERGARELLNRLLGFIYGAGNRDLHAIKSRSLELMVLLSRATIDAGADIREVFLYNTIYMNKLEEANSIDELNILLTEALHHFTDYSFDFSSVRHSDTVYRIMEYIKSNFGRKISLDDIAEYVYLSRSYVSGIFKAETGQTLSSYMNGVRIEKAKQMLKNPAIPLCDISGMCGFEDQSYFTKVFKKMTGTSPKKYRDRYN